MRESFKLNSHDEYFTLDFDKVELLRFIQGDVSGKYYYTSGYMNIEYDYVNADSFSEAVGELINIIYDFCQDIIYKNEQIVEQIERMWGEGDELYNIL